jgi:hypothetical protein
MDEGDDALKSADRGTMYVIFLQTQNKNRGSCLKG